MCTSFIHRKNGVLVAMNFDNNGMKYEIDLKGQNRFTVNIDGGRGKVPSFGINGEGTFINHLLVDSNGKGQYRRPGKNVTHTSKLVKDILDRTIAMDELNSYLQKIEVVNVPDFSAHNMISDSHGNVWVVEPGRGTLFSPVKEKSHFVMSNFSLIDYDTTGSTNGDGFERYEAAEKRLCESDDLSVADAFRILDATAQKDGEWTTAFSMVYSHKERTVYYCIDSNFGKIFRHPLKS